MSEVFAVFRQGVYRHECGGIFTTLERAVEVAQARAEADVDSYHSYTVVPFTLDTATPVEERGEDESDRSWGSPDLLEAASVFSCSKPQPAPDGDEDGDEVTPEMLRLAAEIGREDER